MNNDIINMLKQLVEITKGGTSATDKFRIKAFTTAIKAIENYDKPIKSGTDARKIPGVGKGIADRIDEFLETGKLKEIEAAKGKIGLLTEFTGVYGVGPVTANKWIKKGYKNVKDVYDAVKDGELEVNTNQLIGLKYYYEYIKRIPRAEIDLLNEKLNNIILSQFRNLDLIYAIAGSYRRKMKDSGDIDIIITDKKGIKESSEILKKIINILKKNGVITHTLSLGVDKFLGLAKIKKLHRRLDIQYIPRESWSAGLLYFTGDKQFNVCMRQIAHEKGFLLNEKGLFSSKSGKMIKTTTEREIFEKLGMHYRKPENRNMK